MVEDIFEAIEMETTERVMINCFVKYVPLHKTMENSKTMGIKLSRGHRFVDLRDEI